MALPFAKPTTLSALPKSNVESKCHSERMKAAELYEMKMPTLIS